VSLVKYKSSFRLEFDSSVFPVGGAYQGREVHCSRRRINRGKSALTSFWRGLCPLTALREWYIRLFYFPLAAAKNRLPGCRIEPGSTRANFTDRPRYDARGRPSASGRCGSPYAGNYSLSPKGGKPQCQPLYHYVQSKPGKRQLLASVPGRISGTPPPWKPSGMIAILKKNTRL
jgi:hypothetical protein